MIFKRKKVNKLHRPLNRNEYIRLQKLLTQCYVKGAHIEGYSEDITGTSHHAYLKSSPLLFDLSPIGYGKYYYGNLAVFCSANDEDEYVLLDTERPGAYNELIRYKLAVMESMLDVELNKLKENAKMLKRESELAIDKALTELKTKVGEQM